MVLYLNIDFLFSITDYIVLFPIKWHIFSKKILDKATIYDNIIIFPINNINKYENIFNEIYEIIENYIKINRVIKNEDFLIIYTDDKENLNLLINWINLILLRVFLEINENVAYYLNKDNSLYCNGFIIKCIDHNENIILFNNSGNQVIISYNYNYFEFFNEVKKLFIYKNCN